MLIFLARGVFVFVAYDDMHCSSNPVCQAWAHCFPKEGHFLIYDSPLYSLTTSPPIRLLMSINDTLS